MAKGNTRDMEEAVNVSDQKVIQSLYINLFQNTLGGLSMHSSLYMCVEYNIWQIYPLHSLVLRSIRVMMAKHALFVVLKNKRMARQGTTSCYLGK